MFEDQKKEAQQVLDQLSSDGSLPFKLIAHTVECVRGADYIVLFFHSSLYSVDVVWQQGTSFKGAFRESLLDLLERRKRKTGKAWSRGEGSGR